MHADQQEMDIDANCGRKTWLLSFPRAGCKKKKKKKADAEACKLIF